MILFFKIQARFYLLKKSSTDVLCNVFRSILVCRHRCRSCIAHGRGNGHRMVSGRTWSQSIRHHNGILLQHKLREVRSPVSTRLKDIWNINYLNKWKRQLFEWFLIDLFILSVILIPCEQSSPVYRGSHTHRPASRSYTPRWEQAGKQRCTRASRSLHAAPRQPARQTQRPRTHDPWPPQVGSRQSSVPEY